MPADPLTPPSAPTAAPLLVSGRDAARMLAISERTLYAMRMRGELRAVMIGAAVRFSVDGLRDFIHQKK